MSVFSMPNGVAPVQAGAGGQPEADYINLGGNFISLPAAVVHDYPGRVSGVPGLQGEITEVFVFGVQADRAMYCCTSSRTPLGDYYGTWASLGGIFTSAPAAVSGGLGQIDVFGRDSNFQLAHLSWDGTKWTDWENLGGTLASEPVAVSWGPNRIDVFALSNDGSVGHTWWDGQIWNQWQYLLPPAPGISFAGTPSAITWGPERLDVFIQGSDGNLYHFSESAGAFGAPEALGAPTALAPAYAANAWPPTPTAIAVATNHLVVLGLANQWNNEEEPVTPVSGYRIWDGAIWRGWAPLDSCGLPSRYRFSVDYVTCQTPRALLSDSDSATASITAGNGQIQTVSQALPSLGGSNTQAQSNLLFFEPVPVELCETAIFSYQVLNSQANEPNDINTALEKVAADLAQFALKSIEGDLASAKAITSITVATSVVPVVGTILTLLAEWLLSELPGAVVAGQCDGMVALEQDVLLGMDIASGTAGGKVHSVTTQHPGTTSAQGCGPNSQYQVQWSIQRV